MSKKKKRNKGNVEQVSEEELAELFGFDFISGFTPGGVPYGVTKEEAEQLESDSFPEGRDTENSDMPF